MTKYFDIKPPRPKFPSKYPSQKETKSKLKSPQVLPIIIFIFIMLIVFSILNKKDNFETTPDLSKIGQVQETTPSPTSTQTAPSVTQTNTTETQTSNQPSVNGDIKITVLNGTKIQGIANEAKKKLEENNFTVEKTSDAKNLQTNTVVFYTQKNIELAKKIKEALPVYNPIIQVDNSLADDNNILIILGQNIAN